MSDDQRAAALVNFTAFTGGGGFGLESSTGVRGSAAGSWTPGWPASTGGKGGTFGSVLMTPSLPLQHVNETSGIGFHEPNPGNMV